jgi:hypothetical protein
MTNPPLNKVCTMSSSADDFVSYYSRVLQGEFFKNPQTLSQFRQILSMGDAIWKMPLPLGVSAFLKGGSIDVPGFHALCVPRGMFFDDRWVYFCLTINWTGGGRDRSRYASGIRRGGEPTTEARQKRAVGLASCRRRSFLPLQTRSR